MKTVIGRGRDYQKALRLNLVKSLETHKKITTTKRRARLLKTLRLGKDLVLTPLASRRGDSAPMVLVELVQPKKQDANATNKTKRNTKKVAPR
jgi:ribosomal protein L17